MASKGARLCSLVVIRALALETDRPRFPQPACCVSLESDSSPSILISQWKKIITTSLMGCSQEWVMWGSGGLTQKCFLNGKCRFAQCLGGAIRGVLCKYVECFANDKSFTTVSGYDNSCDLVCVSAWRQEAARAMHDSRAWEFLFATPCFLNSDTPSVIRYAFNLITNFQGIKKHYYVKFVYLSYASKFRKCKKCRNNASLMHYACVRI